MEDYIDNSKKGIKKSIYRSLILEIEEPKFIHHEAFKLVMIILNARKNFYLNHPVPVLKGLSD